MIQAALSAVVFSIIVGFLSPAVADPVRSLPAKGAFEDVKFELNNAIVSRGYVIDFAGNIGAMLVRTGADVGSTKPIYKNAEYMTFCSAKLSRDMMEADPLNIAFCPYVVFVFESADKPGQVTVGYRRPEARGPAASAKALTAIDSLLDQIIKDAAK
jgi:uncharacterized protein (DUF302 family)